MLENQQKINHSSDPLFEIPLKDKYNGIICTKNAAQGIQLSIKNAHALLEESKLLFDNKHYARSVTLSILAIEEKGKIESIKKLLIHKQKIASAWKEFRSHKSKNFVWQFPIFNLLQINDPDYIINESKPDSFGVEYLDQLKQASLYIEGIKDHNTKNKMKWFEPNREIGRETAYFIYIAAEQVVKDDGIDWVVEALEVYKKYAVLVEGEVRLTNLIEFYKELESKALITKDRLSRVLSNISKVENTEENDI